MNKTTEDGHIELIRIDALRAGEGTDDERRHVESCDLCRSLLENLETGIRLLQNDVPPSAAVPRSVDGTILREYRRHFARPRRRWPLPAAGAAAAAVLAIAVSGQLLRSPMQEEAGTSRPAVTTEAQKSPLAAEDVNGDGRVDILDAFRLARTLKKDGAGRVREDFNEDGRVNRIDVEILAQRVVSL